MKGEAQLLIQFFDGSKTRLIIPIYQRNYDWKEENCEQLFNDLLNLNETKRNTHFFGSIVSCIQSGSEAKYIIDGQQRITTVSLLLIAIVNALKAGAIKEKEDEEESKLGDEILNNYLVDKYDLEQRKVKLKPIKKDMDAFDALIYKSKDQYIKESNVTRNYEFFYDRVINSGLTANELVNAINKLEVIHIYLENDDDPQLIYESLNSTGLDLSEADKIRNYLLMSLPPKEQEDLYRRFWNPIEEFTKYEPSSFVRDYLTMKQGKIGRIDKIYFIFKKYAENSDKSRAALLKDMYQYAKIYSQIDNGKFETDKLNQKLRQLRILDSTIAYPFFLAFFDYASKNNLSESEICRVIDLIESYWARRIICNIPSNSLNKVFATLHRDVLNHISKVVSDNKPAYIDILTYILLNKGSSSIFPRDEVVKREFVTRQVYKMPTNARMFLFERLENRDNKERHDVVKGLSEKIISIEHIMPQTLSKQWKKDLGTEWDHIHKIYLHTMANLTLTAYNSQYSNLSFLEKRDMEKGFKESAFRLNNYVKSCDKWTEDELKERQTKLLGVVMKLWPMPVTTFMPTNQEAESVSLEDTDFDFIGKKLQAYILYGVRYTVNTWKDMLSNVCRHILLNKRSTIEWLCANEKWGFYSTPEVGKIKIDDNIYLCTTNNTNAKMRNLYCLFKECNIPPSELIFEFRSNTVDKDEE